MEIAISTLFNLPKSFEETLRMIPKLITPFIEFVDAGSHCLNPSRILKLQELKESHDLSYSVHAPFTDVNISAYDPSIREAILRRIEKSIMWTSKLGGDYVVFHPGNYTALERAFPGEAWRINLRSVKRLVTYADNLGVMILIENVPEPFPYVMKSVGDFERFYEEVGAKTDMVLDVAHANLRGETLKFIERFGDRIAHVHVSDNNGDADSHLQVGGGSIDWPRVMAALKTSPFDGWVTIESYEGVIESFRLLEALK